MLPGFRFLFAAIMLSMSLLIFGLGAAALLRAAHESFASNSTWRAAPEVPFAQVPQTTLPVLATLRIEPAIEKPADTARMLAAPAEPAAAIPPPTPVDPVSADQPAVSKPAEAPVEMAKAPDASLPVTEEKPPEAVPAATPSAEVSAAEEIKTATVSPAEGASASVRSEPAAAPPEPVVPPAPTKPPAVISEAKETPLDSTETESNAAATKIATLGGPPVDIADIVVKPVRARTDQDVSRKRAQARRSSHRRRLAWRAQLAAQQQLQASPFGQPQQTFPPASSPTR